MAGKRQTGNQPVASLDPLAHRDFLSDLGEAAAERQMSVLLFSHLIGISSAHATT